MEKIRILIVEDENVVARDIQHMVENLGHEVVGTAASGEQALQNIADFAPHLVFMDIALQGSLDGVETAERIRKIYKKPVIYLTALTDEQTLQRAKVTEPFGYLFKPFEQKELHAAIEMALYKHQMEEALKQSTEELHRLALHMQTAREQERTHIAYELHDELGQALTALKMDIVWIRHKLPLQEKSLQDKIKSAAQLIDATIKKVQRLSMEIRPGILDDLGLAAAVEWQAADFQNRTGISCRLTSPEEGIPLNKDQATAIFRIFQEALTNIARHSQATKVEVALAVENKDLILQVIDNGRGIKEKDIASPNSLGLIGMRERTFVLGGRLEIRGYPGKGTSVTVRIPLNEEQRRPL